MFPMINYSVVGTIHTHTDSTTNADGYLFINYYETRPYHDQPPLLGKKIVKKRKFSPHNFLLCRRKYRRFGLECEREREWCEITYDISIVTDNDQSFSFAAVSEAQMSFVCVWIGMKWRNGKRWNIGQRRVDFGWMRMGSTTHWTS